jgi:iron(III) transport system ATP-binding protein
LPSCGVASLRGPSGSGKTTVLRGLAGLIGAIAGKMVYEGQAVVDVAAGKLSRPGVMPAAMVFQEYACFPHLSVAANIGYGLVKLAKTERESRVGELANALGLEHALNRRASSLSGGEQQRVAIARTLAVRPGLLLLDEPFSALDDQTRVSARDVVIREIRARGIGAVLVTHDRDDEAAFEPSVFWRAQRSGDTCEITNV